jgi:hypothetical protein
MASGEGKDPVLDMDPDPDGPDIRQRIQIRIKMFRVRKTGGTIEEICKDAQVDLCRGITDLTIHFSQVLLSMSCCFLPEFTMGSRPAALYMRMRHTWASWLARGCMVFQ